VRNRTRSHVHTHAHTHTCRHTHNLSLAHTHTHAPARTHTHAHTHMHIRTHAQPRKRTHVRTHAHTCTHAHTRTPTHTHTHTHARTHACTHTNTHTHTHTHAPTHTQCITYIHRQCICTCMIPADLSASVSFPLTPALTRSCACTLSPSRSLPSCLAPPCPHPPPSPHSVAFLVLYRMTVRRARHDCTTCRHVICVRTCTCYPSVYLYVHTCMHVHSERKTQIYTPTPTERETVIPANINAC